MKSGTDDLHKLTEAVYKNLVENFNSGVKQILLTGKAYYKALQAVNVTAQAYNEALARVGSAAKICRGGTEEIGEAILQVAEAQKEIQARQEESTKAMFTELVLPLEQKLEKDFKKAHSDAKRYVSEHKVVLSPFNKACESLKKFRKKTKNKMVYDNEKEAQHMRTLEKCQEKLDKFRIQGLKLALLEERRCHCFLLQRLCAISQLKAAGHRIGLNVYSALPDWQQVSSNPHVLPAAADQLIADYMDGPFEPVNGGPGYHGNGFLHRDVPETQSLSNEFRRSKSTQDLYRQSGHFDGTKTLPPRSVPPQPPKTQVQAMHTFTGSQENQLSFAEGDLITVMGEHSDGWQYGQNNAIKKLGWFPLSFTQPVVNNTDSLSPGFKMLSSHQRYKSMGDLLDSRSLSEYTQHYEHNIPGNIQRPKSLYEGPSQGTSVPQSTQVTGVSHRSSASSRLSAGSQYGSPVRQQTSMPPPPPPPLDETRADRATGDLQENATFRMNPMFASVSLRQTKTNDRSAPKL